MGRFANKLNPAIAVLSLVIFYSGNASATLITDGSFETPALTINTFSSPPPPTFTAWTLAGGGFVLINDQNNGRIQSGKDLQQFLQLNAANSTASQTLGAPIGTNELYTLSAVAGTSSSDVGPGYTSGGAKIELIAFNGATETVLSTATLASTTINAVAGTLLSLATLPYSTAVDPTYIGESLIVRIIGLDDGGRQTAGYETIYDNVVLTAVPAPEPSSIALIVIGMLGSMAAVYRRRRDAKLDRASS